MSFLFKKSHSKGNEETVDRRQHSKEKSKCHHQQPPPDFKEQAMRYGMNMKSQRDQQLNEQSKIERKMAKQTGRKLPKSTGGSQTEDIRTAFKVANFIRKHKQ